jgi:hypothetical protein
MNKEELCIKCKDCQHQDKPCCEEHRAMVAMIRLECLADRLKRAQGTKFKAFEGLRLVVNR